MYRINNNKRIQRSANLIKDALITCLQEKDFNEITVSDIQRISGVSRATFYRIFDNTSDVLTYHCELLMQTVNEQLEEASLMQHRDFTIFILQSWLKDHVVLEALFKCGREDIYQNVLLKHAEEIHSRFQTPGIPTKDMDYLIAGICGSLMGILRTWVKYGKQESAEELFEMFYHMDEVMKSAYSNPSN